MNDFTRILSQIESGDPAAAAELLPLVYQELRKLAAAKLKQERPDQTLSNQAEAAARVMAVAESDAKGKALRQAEAVRLTAQSSAMLPSNPGLALLLAMEGAKRAAPRQAEQNDALLAAMNQCRELRTIMAPAVAPTPSLDREMSEVCRPHLLVHLEGIVTADNPP
jgi:hypothetical protein